MVLILDLYFSCGKAILQLLHPSCKRPLISPHHVTFIQGKTLKVVLKYELKPDATLFRHILRLICFCSLQNIYGYQHSESVI